MIGQRTKATIARLREQADDLDGKFNLYDYCANDIRESWLDDAKEARDKADQLEARLRQRKRRIKKRLEELDKCHALRRVSC